jgi:hypothetical protein
MKRFISLCGLVALLALPAFAGDGTAMGCCAKQTGVQRSVANLDNGVRITMTSTDAKTVAMLQENSAKADAEGCANCPLRAQGVTRTVEKTADGIVVTATTSDPALLAKLQQHAAMMSTASCCGKGQAKTGCCGRGNGAGAGCQRAAKTAPAAT